jgi:hypothetical protein
MNTMQIQLQLEQIQLQLEQIQLQLHSNENSEL